MFALLRQEVVILIVLALLVLGGSQLPKIVRSLATERERNSHPGGTSEGIDRP